MIQIITALLILGIILRLFTPKKPNYLFGYQLGSAKKSDEHWKIANKHASNSMIIVYSSLLVISLIFNFLNFNGEIIILALIGIGFISTYFYIENKLKKIN